jgi:hypothetical protein
MPISRLLALALLICLASGCTKVVSYPVAAFHPGSAPTTQPVPKTAVYSIRFLDEKGKKFGGIPGSQRLLAAGEHAGFELDESGVVVAVAANERFAIEAPPGQGMVWSTTYRKPTQFSKEMAKATVTAGKAAAVGGGLFMRALLKLDDDDDEDCQPPPAPRPVPR